MEMIDVPYLRLFNQQILEPEFKTVKEVVGWMGAMQAQDYAMAKWAIGLRLPNSTDQTIESAFDNGDILRTHLMRPTWHFVSSDDIYWMLVLSAPQIRAVMKSRDKILGLDQSVYEKSNVIIEHALQAGNHLTRDELVKEFVSANIAIDNNRVAHYLMRAEIDGLICSGKTKNKKQTFALLRDRVSKVESLTRQEAIGKLARKYFRSHCPATLQDFIWWSGLSVNESKLGLESIKSDLVSETINNQTYWFTNYASIPEPENHSVFLLPAYDEFLISYRDRTASLPFEIHNKAVSNNGIFKPTIVINGQVTGLWKRVNQKDKVSLQTELFQPVSKPIYKEIENAANQFEHFLNKKLEYKPGN